MADTDALYLENIDEYVNDESRIVTYKWLSSSLKIPANKSKEMLNDFVEKEIEKGNQLTVTYIVGGKLAFSASLKGQKYIIVKKELCEETRKLFEQVTCCHIYSVQKSTLKNPEILGSIDQDAIKSSIHELSSWSGIHCPEAIRGESSVTSRERVIQDTPQQNGFTSKVSPQKDSKGLSDSQSSEKHGPISSSSRNKRTTATSFFGAANSKKQDKKAAPEGNKEKNEKTNASDANTIKKEKAVGGANATKKEKEEVSFFGKPLGSTSKLKVKEERNSKTRESKEETPKMKECDMEIDVVNEDNQKEEYKEVTTNKKSKRDLTTQSDEDMHKVKRRKTVIEESESEEDDFESFIKSSKGKNEEMGTTEKLESSNSGKDKNSQKSKEREGKKARKEKKPEMMEQSKPAMEEPSTKKFNAEEAGNNESKPREKRRIRRKVMKSKTFMNDEGYMVTEKVYESESATDESETEETAKTTDVAHKRPKEITKANNKFKIEASKHKTQASLMNFFKKK